MRSLWLLFLLLSLGSVAQDSIHYDSLIVRAEGKQKKVKYKSAVSGKKQVLNHKIGLWTYYDSDGTIVKQACYRYSKFTSSSYLHGDLIYYQPGTGDTIIHRVYGKNGLKAEKAYREAIIVEKGRVTVIKRDFQNKLEITNYQPTGSMPFSIMVKMQMEDPTGRYNPERYKPLEDSLGDPSLTKQASFPADHTYNYVSNPGFERLNEYRSMISFTNQVKNWIPASESPDLFVSSEYAHTGNGFIGFRVFSLTKDIEYVQNELKASLKKDSVYCFSAYLRLSTASRFASNAIGIKFSENPMEIPLDKLYSVKADIQLESQILLYKTRWMRIECTYKAKGGEKWLIIGSFKDHTKLKMSGVPGSLFESYYYLDDVSLVPVADPSLCACNFDDSRLAENPVAGNPSAELGLDNLKEGESLVLEDIHFENDRSELLPESLGTLMMVLKYLQSHPTAQVEISGHTSSTGDYDHNMKLSAARADAVRQFLVLNGVDGSRITTRGYGPDKPISANDTPDGQALNRRVEFKLVKL